jgi:hypothetical protein
MKGCAVSGEMEMELVKGNRGQRALYGQAKGLSQRGELKKGWSQLPPLISLLQP